MHFNTPQQGLALANELVAEGRSTFTFEEVERRLRKSKTATANLLKRMEKAGLIDRVRRGHYVVRQLGMLGTPAAAEDVALSVGAALTSVSHRIAYRSALYEHDLVVHPARSIQVAAERRVRTRTLSGRPLQVVIESPEALEVGRVPWGASYVSDRHRAVLDAAHRPRLVGGIEVLAEAFAAAAPELHAEILMDYARRLGWAAALRRLGSLADALALQPLEGALQPVRPITADLDLEPGTDEPTFWRDSRWRVRWPRTVDELLAVIGQ
jgi:predicted transcriptional regulator of viral defense system